MQPLAYAGAPISTPARLEGLSLAEWLQEGYWATCDLARAEGRDVKADGDAYVRETEGIARAVSLATTPEAKQRIGARAVLRAVLLVYRADRRRGRLWPGSDGSVEEMARLERFVEETIATRL